MAHTAVKVRHQTKGLVRRIDWSLGGLPAYSLHSFWHPPRLPKGHCKSSSLLDSWRSAFGGGDFFESRLPIIFWFTRNFHTCSFMAILRLFLFSIPTSCMKKSKLRETRWHTQDHGWTASIFRKEWKLFKSSGFLFFFFPMWPILTFRVPSWAKALLNWPCPPALLLSESINYPSLKEFSMKFSMWEL